MIALQLVVMFYALFCLGFVIVRICRNIKNTKRVSEQTNEEILKYMNEHHNPSECAGAFVRLVKQDYVLIHTMGNNGNKYNDELQAKRYAANFTPEVAQGIKNVKGKYI